MKIQPRYGQIDCWRDSIGGHYLKPGDKVRVNFPNRFMKDYVVRMRWESKGGEHDIVVGIAYIERDDGTLIDLNRMCDEDYELLNESTDNDSVDNESDDYED